MERLEMHELIGRWWANYDEGEFDVLNALATEDVVFTCRTDTGTHPYETFIAASTHGRAALDAHHRPHRAGSPYPLRHNATNIHTTADRGSEVDLRTYLSVTDIVDGKPSHVSSGIVDFTIRDTADGLRIAAFHVVLDFAATKVWA
ncbi:MAG: hypothetical protein JWN62_3019 [Acidimicrobiales bacterium]|nr:hypothetical protein [Acidimicrobiales bacterium]